MHQTLYKIKGRVWTKQVMDLSPLHTYTHGYGLSTTLARHIGGGFGIFFVYYKRGESEVWFPQAQLDRIGAYYFSRRAQAPKLHKKWLAIARRVERLARKIWRADLRTLSDQALLRQLEQIVKPFQEAWAWGGFVESYDNTSHNIIERKLARATIKLSADELSTLLQPTQLTLVQQEHGRYLRLLSDWSKPKLNQHLADFFFIKANYYEAPVMTDKEAIKRLRRDARLMNVKKEMADFRKLVGYYKNLPRAKRRIFTKYKIPAKVQTVLNFFALASLWRDERKHMHQLGSVAIEKITREVMRRSGVPAALASYLIIADFRRGFAKLGALVPVLRRRAQESLLVIEDSGRYAWYFGQEARALRNQLEAVYHTHQEERITGQVACPGQVRGRVKIIKSTKDFSKFKRGDILVASMTRVEFMPVVRLAAAIVTDEGGVTSHAAIVSRELGIPCIIGTKVATKVLRDGDKIEVDADNGIIRIL